MRKLGIFAEEAKRTSKAFLSAYRKGRKAFAEHGKDAKCPYPDLTTYYHNGVTFSRSFRKFWQNGLEDAAAGLPERYEAK